MELPSSETVSRGSVQQFTLHILIVHPEFEHILIIFRGCQHGRIQKLFDLSLLLSDLVDFLVKLELRIKRGSQHFDHFQVLDVLLRSAMSVLVLKLKHPVIQCNTHLDDLFQSLALLFTVLDHAFVIDLLDLALMIHMFQQTFPAYRSLVLLANEVTHSVRMFAAHYPWLTHLLVLFY